MESKESGSEVQTCQRQLMQYPLPSALRLGPPPLPFSAVTIGAGATVKWSDNDLF